MGEVLVWLFGGLGTAAIVAMITWLVRRNTKTPAVGGGRGGNATVGGRGYAAGGPGGGGGPGGAGGAGGEAHVQGDGIALGGEGGEAGQGDRGGRGGRSPAEVFGMPNQQFSDGTWLYDYGRGGDGADPQPTKNPDPEQS